MSRILIADDDPVTLAVLNQVLVKAGYETSQAQNGNIAAQLAQDFEPDVVVTDILMPEKDGFELILELRKQRSHAKIIAISGGRSPGFETSQIANVLDAFEVDAFLKKPVLPKDLLAAVQSATPPLSHSQTN